MQEELLNLIVKTLLNSDEFIIRKVVKEDKKQVAYKIFIDKTKVKKIVGYQARILNAIKTLMFALKDKEYLDYRIFVDIKPVNSFKDKMDFSKYDKEALDDSTDIEVITEDIQISEDEDNN